MRDRNAVRLDLIHMLPRFLEEWGVSTSRVMARAGIEVPAPEWPHQIVARAQVCAALNETARIVGDTAVGLLLATAADPVKLGPTGRALFAGRTLRESLQSHARQMPALQAGVRFRLEERGGTAYWHHQLLDSDCEDARILNDGVAVLTVGAIRSATQPAGLSCRLTLPHRARVAPRLYEDFFQMPVRFGVGNGVAVTFDARALDLPIRGGLDPDEQPEPAARMPDGRPAIAEDAGDLSDAELVRRIHRIADSMMAAGTLSFLGVARTLGYAPRTLQRQLAGCGLRFEALVDELRRSKARALLADASFPIGSVAMALGYSHPAHFVRAFRRWEAASPIEYRRGLARNGN